ncbi:hypothetical protein L226DRAFT_520104 [Lentinus tigrinus ALCF2SS1-7]|uniref:Uncharacterized protein n=1 Tax=Lentinus tigrinus ALCF2SS1-6 TaxID=1328759 RepID=A0A5C2SNY7_9APHY|nr:hypothetical protein L227DRAFT_560283 [Lentinus tigrinus ALCF2SS1-6]RPD79034.1 hypothetical protein L226DRAFT_520104 [Lentinus tigrinus ALCF2SS1-7]
MSCQPLSALSLHLFLVTIQLLVEDSWSAPNGTMYQTYSLRINPSNQTITVSTSSPHIPVTIHTPSLAAHPDNDWLSWCKSWQSLSSGEVTVEEIKAVTIWLQSHSSSVWFLLSQEPIPSPFLPTPIPHPIGNPSDASVHGVSPADAIASSLISPSDMSSLSMSRTSSHGDPFTPADTLQMMSLVHHKDIPENVDADNDVIHTSDGFKRDANAWHPNMSMHGMSPANVIASSLVSPSNTYSSGMSPMSSHGMFTPAGLLQTIPAV